jgi:flagellar biogenesis protein FliO
MKQIGFYFLAGLAAMVILKGILTLLAPLVAFLFGMARLALLLGVVVVVGWLVVRLLEGTRPQEG